MAGGDTGGFALLIGVAIFLIAMVFPIFFDVEVPQPDFPVLGAVEKALCFIDEGTGSADCTEADDTFTFIGENDLSVETTDDKEVTWTLATNGTVRTCSNIGGGEIVCTGLIGQNLAFKSFEDGQDIEITSDASTLTFDVSLGLVGLGSISNATSLGGDADVFKELTPAEFLNFRGISEAGSLEVTQNATTILVNASGALTLGEMTDVIDGACPTDGHVIVKNTTSAIWECREPSDFIKQSGGLNSNELLRGHIAQGSAGDVNQGFVDYEMRMWEFKETGPGNHDTEKSWSYGIFDSYNGTSNITVKVFWTVDNFNGAGDVCFDVQLAPADVTDDISDFSALATTLKSVCKAAPSTDIFEVTEVEFTPAEHGISQNDIVLIQLTRNADSNPSDTYEEDVQGYGAAIEW